VNPAPELLVMLNVGGTVYQTSINTLRKYPNSRLGMLFSGQRQLAKNKEGHVLLDRNAKPFGYLLEWLRSGEVPANFTRSKLEKLKNEASFWHITMNPDHDEEKSSKKKKEKLFRPHEMEVLKLIHKAASAKKPITLPGVDLRGYILSASVLSNGNLYGSDLSNANIVRANLKGANLRESICNSTQLSHSVLDTAGIPKRRFDVLTILLRSHRQNIKKRLIDIMKTLARHF